MNKKTLRQILSEDGYKLNTINSIMTGRRKPNSNKRYEYEKKYSIPFNAWIDIKSYLNKDNSIKNSNTAMLQTKDKGNT